MGEVRACPERSEWVRVITALCMMASIRFIVISLESGGGFSRRLRLKGQVALPVEVYLDRVAFLEFSPE